MSQTTKTTTDLLSESQRADNLRDRHRDYYVALAEQAERELRGPDQAAWRETLESEYDNLRLGLEWSLSKGESEESLRLAGAMHEVWYVRGDTIPARPWLERALAVDETSATALRAKILEGLALVVWNDSDPPASFALAQEAVRVARETGDREAIHRTLMRLTWMQYTHELGIEAVRSLTEESLEIARELGDELAIADSLSRLAQLISQDEGRESGRALSEEAISLYRKLGDRESIAWAVYGQGWSEDPSVGAALAEEALAIGRELSNDVLILCVIELIAFQKWFSGDYAGAVKVYEEALEEYQRPGRKWPVPWQVSWMLSDMSLVELDMGDYDSAGNHAHEALEINQRHSYRTDQIWNLSAEAKVAAAQGDFTKARSKSEEAVKLARELRLGQLLTHSLLALADVALWSGDLDGAREAAEEVRGTAIKTGARRNAERLLGSIALAEGDFDKARSYLEQALESIRTHPWWPYEEPMTQLELGRVVLTAGELETASAIFGAALTKAQEIGHKPYVAWALEEFGALAAERKEFEQGAQLYGAAESIREETQAKVPMDQRSNYERGLAAIKAGIDEESFDKAWASGKTMNLEEAVRYALEPEVTN